AKKRTFLSCYNNIPGNSLNYSVPNAILMPPRSPERFSGFCGFFISEEGNNEIYIASTPGALFVLLLYI
ncbi:MAG: hypothetical protein WAW23_06910, partial [Candidatus Methanoperedens sp.]